MNIFDEDGYLKPEFINVNYCGLVGWPCEVTSSDILVNLVKEKYNLMGCHKPQGNSSLYYWFGGNPLKNFGETQVQIPKFTPADISVGELCWMKHMETGDWILLRLARVGSHRFYSNYQPLPFVKCVPYLIAENKEQAELLSNWADNV